MSKSYNNLDDASESDHTQAKVQQIGPGRRAIKIDEMESPLGNFLQSKMELREITQTEFARMLGISRDQVRRLIFTGMIEIHHTLVASIVQALDLSDTEQEEFYNLLAENKRIEHLTFGLPEEVSSTDANTASEEGVWLSIPHEGITSVTISKERETAGQKHADERGRKAADPQTDIGRFLAAHLQAKYMSRSDLARAADVNPATITRLMLGKTAAIRDDTKERICRALGLDKDARHIFDKLLAQEQRAAIHKFSHIDLDELAEDLKKLQGLYDKGYALFVRLETRIRYRVLRNAGFTKKESRAIELQWCFGMLSGSADEAVLNWETRVDPTIKFYTMIEQEIRERDMLREQAAIYIAHIQARRAPLYRQLEEYQKSLYEFTEALNVYAHYLKTPEDRRLLVELYYSRAHVHAVRGERNLWQEDIRKARMRAGEEKDEKRRRELVGLVDYTEGEGYKRLAFNESNLFTREQKEEFARKGLKLFEVSHMEESRWVGHRILNGVAQAQCMALIDPETALKDAERLRAEALQFYPSIVQKIDRIIDYARKRLM